MLKPALQHDAVSLGVKADNRSVAGTFPEIVPAKSCVNGRFLIAA